MTLAKQESEDIFKKQMQPSTYLALHSTSGFDFHRSHVVRTFQMPLSRDPVLHEIMTSRMWNLCKIILVKLPTARMLHRTAAISSALLVMQLYVSKKSRRALSSFNSSLPRHSVRLPVSHFSCDLCNCSIQRRQCHFFGMPSIFFCKA
ncbi:hypothetical protein Plhal304r1_c036g0110771 [Plasmopara halstedii]